MDNETDLPVRKHLAAIAVLYSVFAVCFHLLYGGVGIGLVLALTSSTALMLAFLGRVVPKHTLSTPLLLLLLGASFFLDAPKDSDLILHISQFAFICGLSLKLRFAAILLALILMSLVLLVDQALTLDKYLVVISLGVLGAYLRYLVLGQARSLHETEVLDKELGCKNALSLEQDAEQSFNLHQRYGIACTYLIFDLALDESLSLKLKNEMLGLVVSVWNSRIRQTDYLYKLSDRRFVCVLAATSKEQSMVLQQDILVAINEYEFPEKFELDLQVSAEECSEHESSGDWLSRVYA